MITKNQYAITISSLSFPYFYDFTKTRAFTLIYKKEENKGIGVR